MKLHYWPSDELRAVAERLDVTEDHSELVRDMVLLMTEKRGIGLAATQCGVRKRLFVVDTDPMNRYAFRGAFGNPQIIHGSGEVRSVEGCLSFPGVSLPVKRYESVQVQYWDPIEDKYHERELTGLPAIVFQHELDHLRGVVLIDHVGKMRRRMALEKMRKNK